MNILSVNRAKLSLVNYNILDPGWLTAAAHSLLQTYLIERIFRYSNKGSDTEPRLGSE